MLFKKIDIQTVFNIKLERDCLNKFFINIKPTTLKFKGSRALMPKKLNILIETYLLKFLVIPKISYSLTFIVQMS